MKQYDHIRKNLKVFQVPIDKEKLWANTAHAIPHKRKKRGAFFLLLGGALVISSAVTFFTLSDPGSNITTNTEIQSASYTTVTSPSNETNDATRQATTGNTLNATTENESSQELVSKENSIVETSNRRPSIVKATTSSNKGNARKALVASPNTEADNGRVKTQNLSGQSFVSENGSTANVNDPEVLTYDNSNQDASIENTTDPIYLERAPEERIANFLTREIPSLPVSELNILPRENPTSNVIATRTKNKNRINLLIIQGIGWSTMNMVTENPEFQPTVHAWKNKIKSLENLSTSLQASIRLPKGIQVGAGLQYSKLTTQMEYQQTWSETYTEQGITEIIIDEQGNVQNLMGDVHAVRQTIIHSTRFTSHTRLDVEGIVSIPLIRNYRTETGVWVKAGYNILYDAKGTTFGQGDDLVKFSSTDNPYLLQSPFTFGAGIATLYRLNTHLTLNARVGYDRLRYTHGLYDNQISFHHSIFSLGLGAGYIF
jgi:hypothetical protein